MHASGGALTYYSQAIADMIDTLCISHMKTKRNPCRNLLSINCRGESNE